MGVYFIAAGSATNNRYKSLEKPFKPHELKAYMSKDVFERLYSLYGEGGDVYIWGANSGSIHSLRKVKQNEYVVDVKNKEVKNVFEFCFYYKTTDTALQEFIGWDEEKPSSERRPYHYVFFLKNPREPKNKDKSYFAKAFGQLDNSFFLMGQTYFTDHDVDLALENIGSSNEEELLGI